MDVEDRLKLVKRNLEETITQGELRELLESEEHPKAYWGFEPSG